MGSAGGDGMTSHPEQDDQGPTSADLVRDEFEAFGAEWDAMVEAARPTPMQAAIGCVRDGVSFQQALKARRETDPCKRCGGSGLELVPTHHGRAEPWDEQTCSHCCGDGAE